MGLPMDQVKLVVEASAGAVNAVYKIAHGSGLLTVFSLLNDLAALKVVQKDVFLAQVKDLDPMERQALLDAFKAKLVLEDKSLENKIESGADCLDEMVDLGFEAYMVVEHLKNLVEKLKALVA